MILGAVLLGFGTMQAGLVSDANTFNAYFKSVRASRQRLIIDKGGIGNLPTSVDKIVLTSLEDDLKARMKQLAKLLSDFPKERNVIDNRLTAGINKNAEQAANDLLQWFQDVENSY